MRSCFSSPQRPNDARGELTLNYLVYMRHIVSFIALIPSPPQFHPMPGNGKTTYLAVLGTFEVIFEWFLLIRTRRPRDDVISDRLEAGKKGIAGLKVVVDSEGADEAIRNLIKEAQEAWRK